MAVFVYKAFDSRGKTIEGHIDAPNSQMAQKKLRQQGLYVKELKEDIAIRDRELFPFLSKLVYRIPRKEIGLFARQLGTLLGAGIPLNEAMNDVWEQNTNRHFKKILAQIKENIVQGQSLSESLASHKDIFPPVYENMVKVGEATGSYEPTLLRLSELEEKNEELKSKAITALIYPAIMFVLSIVVVIFLLTSVVPQIESIFSNFKAELPLPTKIVLGFSKIARALWWLILPLSAATAYGIHRFRQTVEGRKRWDSFVMKIPFFGTLLVKIQVSRFARNLGVLLEANVSLLSALEIVAAASGNEVFRQELTQAERAIREGDMLKNALRGSKILPDMVKGMMAAGESTDRMSELLLKVSDIMDNEIDTAVKGLTNSIEPLMIIVMGFVVGGIMASIMLPLYKMTTLIK
ncbi:MAG: type II secretion system F family protein [Spirochaetia bacterium]|nr:type II secretion system F family protein [Spirochaetia bacterium]